MTSRFYVMKIIRESLNPILTEVTVPQMMGTVTVNQKVLVVVPTIKILLISQGFDRIRRSGFDRLIHDSPDRYQYRKNT